MQERVQKILASCGIASRRHAEEMISEGRITVNGTVCTLGDKADISVDQICKDGVPVAPQKYVYIMLHKPRGYVSTASDEKARRTVLDLVDCGVRVYPVGRLDMDSEGLLLLTNDGALTNHLLHPSQEVEKTYLVWLQGTNSQKLAKIGREMDLDGYRICPATVQVLSQKQDSAKISLTIHEGRNRQIRKMAEKCGMTVTRLCRIREAGLELGDLPKGSWRYLTSSEIQQLKKRA